ncbi:HNH endonuclease [Fulvimarina sp. 2208YS6-2-32]|uniref:HNH endonuclease n=1 Tax=Fulvimarina uroteuthidis TaxID=3098149 RepID=A0ABU5I701_9HYPH|nr:HNH endonuclease [Fulvimarina sp. 2208YS6-2-32]MDY8111142.1 HNH endonuclease [Fulvimarina sp. 2208YS6-2-32]
MLKPNRRRSGDEDTKCEPCGTHATMVNYIAPHKGDKHLFQSRSNWQAICAPCHNGAVQSSEGRPV